MDQAVDERRLRFARATLWSVLGAILFTRVVAAFDDGFGWLAVGVAALSYPPLIAILARRWGPRVRYGLVAALGVVTMLPFLVVGTRWEWMPWALAAGVLCALPARVAWPIFGAILAGIAVGTITNGEGIYRGTIGREIITADDALIVFSLYVLIGMLRHLQATQGELARLALVRERLRIDGELREVLGSSLQAIAFRLRRAGAEEPEDSRRDIRGAVDTARRTLAEVRAVADGYRRDPLLADKPPIESPRMARLALLAVASIQCLLVLDNLVLLGRIKYPHTGPGALTVAVVVLAALVILLTRRPTGVTLVVQALLILAPFSVIHADAWSRVLPLLTGAVLVQLKPPRSWAIAVLIMAGHVWLYRAESMDTVHTLTILTGHVIIALWVFSLYRLADLVALLRRARGELADAAVVAERTRVAADLHDVLGFSLSAVALKGELAERLLARDPGRVAAELASLTALVDQSFAELGAITGDRVRLRFSAEVGAARGLLEAAGVKTVVTVETGVLPEALDTVLATALRETVTNILRHSAARSCTIAVSVVDGAVRLRVVNDGAGTATPGQGGSGLASLARRTGGRLVAGRHPDGRFEVIAHFPSDPARLACDPDRVDPVLRPQLGAG